MLNACSVDVMFSNDALMKPWSDDSRATIHEVHRRVECFESATDLDITFDPRFDYGRGETRLETSEHGVLVRGTGMDNIVAEAFLPPTGAIVDSGEHGEDWNSEYSE